MRYFITFACYGAHLHGDDTGSVDRYHNLFGSRPVKPDPHRALAEREKMPQPPYWLDPDSREVVLTALRQHCEHRGWNLLAAHVRTNHVHVVVEAEVQPERVMVEFKSYASRALTRLSHLEGIFAYFRLETGVKLSGCNGGTAETAAVKTYPL